MELHQAELIANELLIKLAPTCERIAIAGSIRRWKPDVGDIELLCVPRYVVGVDQLDREIGALALQGILKLRLNKLGRRVYGPLNKLMVHVPSGIGVDVFSTTEECWPVALVVRTGGKGTNQEIATRALERGMSFHSYGRGFTQADGSELICRSEADVFRAVGLAYKEPCERR